MHRNLISLAVSGSMAFALVLPGPVAAFAAPAHACKPGGYSSQCKNCKSVPATGTFSLQVPGGNVKIMGAGNGKSKGTSICLARVALPEPSLGGIAIRVRATGPFRPLHVSKGKLYRFHPASNKLTTAKAITRAGIYQITPG